MHEEIEKIIAMLKDKNKMYAKLERNKFGFNHKVGGAAVFMGA